MNTVIHGCGGALWLFAVFTVLTSACSPVQNASNEAGRASAEKSGTGWGGAGDESRRDNRKARPARPAENKSPGGLLAKPALVSLSASSLQVEKKRARRLNLFGMIYLAVRRSPDLVSADESLETARIGLRSAEIGYSWNFTPSAGAGFDDDGVNTTFGVQATRKTTTGGSAAVHTGTTRSSSETYTSDVTLTLQQPLLRGLGPLVNAEPLRQARRGLDSAQVAKKRLVEQVILDAVGSFFDVLEQRLTLKMYESSRQRLEKLAAAAEAKQKLGMATRFDVYRAELQLAQAKESLLGARETLGNAEDRIRELLDLPQLENFELVVPEIDIPDKVEIDISHAWNLAAISRRDLAETRRRAFEDSEIAEKIAEHNLLPSIDLTLSIGRYGYGDDFSESAGLDTPSWSVGIATSGDLLRRRERLSIETARIRKKAALRSYRLQQRQVKREVEAQVRALQRAVRQGRIQEANLEQVKEKLKYATIRHQRGLADNFELVQAEEELVSARLALFRSKRDIILGRLRLLKSLGILYDSWTSGTLLRHSKDYFKLEIK